jgi:murein DD-endopeptidase MepM/ murein hydrolase activator NlpD
MAAAAGTGQKAGVALAAAGVVLTVAAQAAAAGTMAGVADAGRDMVSDAAISAPAEASVAFSRAAVSTQESADGRLKSMLMTASARAISPAQAKGSLAAPLDSLAESSPFGQRVSPIDGSGDFHRGEDFVAACGTGVRAASAGKVTFAGWHPYGGGNRVVIDHGNGLETTYNHLSSFSVSAGQTVGRGEVVAMSGTTGASTGCHLHFEVMVDGQVVDPAAWL